MLCIFLLIKLVETQLRLTPTRLLLTLNFCSSLSNLPWTRNKDRDYYIFKFPQMSLIRGA